MSEIEEFRDFSNPLLDNFRREIGKDKLVVVFHHRGLLTSCHSLFNRGLYERALVDCAKKVTYLFLDFLLVPFKVELQKEDFVSCTRLHLALLF